MAAEALEAALETLRERGEPDAGALRAATRAADDAEIEALEAGSADECAAKLSAVRTARTEIAAVRAEARKSATVRRDELLAGGVQDDSNAPAAAVARDINDSLRRSTGAVVDEVARSHAAGHVCITNARAAYARDVQFY
eukprot:IDg3757t1